MLREEDYLYISRRMRTFTGVNLSEKKKPLIVSRLTMRLRVLGLNDFAEYIAFLENQDASKREFHTMVDLLTTNHSGLFREPHHFEFLTKNILPEFQGTRPAIWSAASSRGQEVYSILMSVEEYISAGGRPVRPRYFASDISSKVLTDAASGISPIEDVLALDSRLRNRYFLRGSGDLSEKAKLKDTYLRQVKFFRLNLTDPTYRLPGMDVIFLRNVLIYFDSDIKDALIPRLHRQLNPGGYLFIGHSESLLSYPDLFTPVTKTGYRRRD